MSLVLVTGHALASSPLVKKWLVNIALLAKTPAQGVILVTLGAAMACMINWGFGLIVGALFAKEVAKRVPGSDYRFLISCAYIGFLTWHGGLSGSIPLVAATPGNPMEKNGWTYSAVRHDFYRVQLIYYPRVINCPSYYDKTDDADGKRSGRN